MFRLLMIFVLCLATLSFGATTAHARCKGSDLRDRLTPQYQERLKTEVARVPFAYGNHWLATKGDRRIHVVGTQHSGDSRMRPMMRKLRPVIAGADAVMLEVTSSQSDTFDEKLKENPSLMLITKGRTLPEMMSSEDWAMLSIAVDRIGLGPEEAARIQPWVLSIFLSTSGCGGRGIASYAGLDDRIERIAIRNRVPIGSLEDVTDGYRALSMQPMRDQLRLLQLDLESGLNYDDQAVTQSNAYFNGSLAEARIIQEWTMYRDIDIPRKEVVRLLRQFDALILDRRNRAWMPVILGAKAKTLVVAVGAAHLPGRAGVLNLLKAKGYKLQRLDQ